MTAVGVFLAAMAVPSPANQVTASSALFNGGFESHAADGPGKNDPAAFPYPTVTHWTYAGASTFGAAGGATADHLLAAVRAGAGAIPATPHGANWLLVDSRIQTRHLYQPIGGITAGELLSVSALIGRPANAPLADFEVALYRSAGGSGLPDHRLAAIGLASPGVGGLAAGAVIEAEASYVATDDDAGEILFVRIGFVGDAPPQTTQALIDHVVVGNRLDTEPPRIAALDPAKGAENVAVKQSFTLTFDKAVRARSGAIALVRADDVSTVETFDVAGSPGVAFAGPRVTLTPSADLDFNTGYFIEIAPTAIEDFSGNPFAGIAGEDGWHFVTGGIGGTVTSQSGKLSLMIDSGGVIRSLSIRSADGGPGFERGVVGEAGLGNATTRDVAVETIDGGLRVVRRIESDGSQATVTETFGPGLEADSIAWEIVIESADGPWTTPIGTTLRIPPVDGDLRFWSAGTRGDLPAFNGYPSPLQSMPFGTLNLRYGGEGNAGSVNHGFSVPIASWLHEDDDFAVSLVQSPFDFIQDMMLRTDESGAVNFERTQLRIGGGNTIRLHMQLVAHPSDWRAGLGFMARQYPAAFDPPNPDVHAIGGHANYADYRGEPLDAERLHRMGYTLNWNASFPWPYLGMSLPPMESDTDEWTSYEWLTSGRQYEISGKREGRPQSIRMMNEVAEALRRQGFHQLEYFTVTEAGAAIVDPAPPRKAATDADLWKDPNDFVHHQIPGANLGIRSWNGTRVVDPGDPAWQTEVLRQITDISTRMPAVSGICIDRLDWLKEFNPKGDDGVTWTGSPKRSLKHSWHEVMEKMLAITQPNHKVVFINSHIMRRIDILRHSDGFYAEQRGTGIHHMLAFAGARKPVIIWYSPAQNHTAFQEGLYLGFYHSLPFPKADHNTRPNEAIEQWFLDYGPLYNAMRGRKWVLEPHVLKVTSGNARANLFEVDSGYVVPVVFGGTAASATVEIGALPITQPQAVEVLHPGAAAPTAITPLMQDGRMVLNVPLVNGCAMVRIVSEKDS